MLFTSTIAGISLQSVYHSARNLVAAIYEKTQGGV
jgi:hypothetical protein